MLSDPLTLLLALRGVYPKHENPKAMSYNFHVISNFHAIQTRFNKISSFAGLNGRTHDSKQNCERANNDDSFSLDWRDEAHEVLIVLGTQKPHRRSSDLDLSREILRPASLIIKLSASCKGRVLIKSLRL